MIVRVPPYRAAAAHPLGEWTGNRVRDRHGHRSHDHWILVNRNFTNIDGEAFYER